MPEILVHLPEPLEPQRLSRDITPRIGDELPDGYVVMRRHITDEDGECEVWVAKIGGVVLSPDILVSELAGMLRDAGLDDQAERLEDAHERKLALSPDEREAIIHELRTTRPGVTDGEPDGGPPDHG
jgi:hypothetical protein